MVLPNKSSKYQVKERSYSVPEDALPSDDALDDRVSQNLSLSILPKTLKRYQGKIYTMKQWLLKREKSVMDAREFSRFLESGGKGGKPVSNGNSAKAWRTAWGYMKDQSLTGVSSSPHDEARLRRQVKGIMYNAGKGSGKSPDAIDSGRLRSMASLFVAWNQPKYALYCFMIFYGGFRMRDGMDITRGAVRFDTDLGTVIVTKRIKSAKPEDIDLGNKLQPFKEVNNLTTLIRSLAQDLEPDDLLLPGITDAHCNILIKKAAAALRWGEGKWTITSLRHGASREAAALLRQMPPAEEALMAIDQENISLRYGHSSLRSKKTYQKSNTGMASKKQLSKGKETVSFPTQKDSSPEVVPRNRQPKKEWRETPATTSPSYVEKKAQKRARENEPPQVPVSDVQEVEDSKIGKWKKGGKY